MAEAWLAWLRMNQGRPAETLSLVRPRTGRGLAAYRFPNAYGGMVATMALAMLGRVDEALSALDTLESDVARMGAHRWTPRPLNLRGWIVRNLGELGEADELNRAAIDTARVHGLDEPLANGLLDLASGRLLAGDFDGADALLREAMPLTEVEHAFRWRHQLRGRLIRARLNQATGDFDGALAGAESLATDAALLGTPRYEIQARLVAAMSSHQVGATPDLETVAELLAHLDEVAGLEGWWITAEVARVFGVQEWEELAGRRVVSLRRRAGGSRRGVGSARHPAIWDELALGPSDGSPRDATQARGGRPHVHACRTSCEAARLAEPSHPGGDLGHRQPVGHDGAGVEGTQVSLDHCGVHVDQAGLLCGAHEAVWITRDGLHLGLHRLVPYGRAPPP